MKLKITLLFSIGLLLLGVNLFAQKQDYVLNRENHPLYKIEKELMLGNKKALLEIAPYFDNKKQLTEFLGYHIIQTTESQVAKRIVDENCTFLDSEISISEKTTTEEFQTFLDKNLDQISFSNYAQAFLLTPLDKRTVKFNIREISKDKKQELIENSNALLKLDWVKINKINVLIKEKNPKALLLISSELYKNRYRFNKSFYGHVDYVNLIKLLTGTEIATENNKNQLTWFIEEDFYPNTSLNLLIYFSNYYKNYKWNSKKSIFENNNSTVNQLSKEELLFELLNSKNDSIAKDAFKQLTNCKVENVVDIAKQYEKSNIKANYILPTFPYRFLSQLVVLSDYCQKNDIDLKGSEDLQINIKLLESKLSFSERRKLEDKLIKSLTLDQITAFEYYAILNEKSWELTYSAGRILDVFYSRNWNDLLNDKKHLKLYLKKSFLFDHLGIIGVCNNYLRKFKNSNSATINQLNVLEETDLDINKQIEYVVKNYSLHSKNANILKKEFEGNKDFLIPNLEAAFSNIKNDTIEKYENEVIDLLSKINYNQIGKALELIKEVKFKTQWKDKYSFIETDFWFFLDKKF
jgi:hypothetical protein